MEIELNFCETCSKRQELQCLFLLYIGNVLAGQRDDSFEEASKVHKLISEERISARERNCPIVNYDPDYPGRPKL